MAPGAPMLILIDVIACSLVSPGAAEVLWSPGPFVHRIAAWPMGVGPNQLGAGRHFRCKSSTTSRLTNLNMEVPE